MAAADDVLVVTNFMLFFHTGCVGWDLLGYFLFTLKFVSNTKCHISVILA